MNKRDNPGLRDLLALPVPVPVGGVVLKIAPMGWMRFAEAIEPLMPALQELPLVLGGYDTMAREDKIAAWAGVVMSHRQELAEFASVASGFDQADVEGLPPGTFIELLIALFELNADFFVQSLPVMLERIAGRLPAMKARMQAALERAQALAPAAASTTPSSA